MPRANWGIDATDVDDFDRDGQYKPYAGPIPQNGVYEWNIKALKFAGATKDKFPQIRVGLELAPREDRDEDQYEGYFIMAFLTVSDKTRWQYVPFLDAIGVSGSEFTRRTITDEEGNIKKIGKWRNTGDEFIAAELRDNDPDFISKNPKKIGWIGALPDDGEDDGDEDYYDEDEPV